MFGHRKLGNDFVKNALIKNMELIEEFRFGTRNTHKSIENCANFIRKQTKHQQSPERLVLTLYEKELKHDEYLKVSNLILSFSEIIKYFKRNLTSFIFSFNAKTNKQIPLLCLENIFQFFPTELIS